MNAWRVEQDTAANSRDDLAAALSANVAAGRGDEFDQPTVEVEFDEPLPIEHIEFSCFGDGTMRGWATAQSGNSTYTRGLDPFDCSDSPYEIDPATFGSQPIDRFEFIGYDSDRDSAWQVTLRHG